MRKKKEMQGMMLFTKSFLHLYLILQCGLLLQVQNIPLKKALFFKKKI